MKKLRVRLILTIGFLITLFTTGLLYKTHAHIDREAEKLLNQQLDMALDFDAAIREYVGSTLRPLMFELLPEGEFLPHAMSTTYVARHIFEDVQKNFTNVIIKFSSENPRNPINQAGPDEIRLITYFKEHPESDVVKSTIDLNGIEHIASVKAMRMEERCLKCHGDPADAPVKLVQMYGPEKGFHFKPGEIVGLDTVAIPVSALATEMVSHGTIIYFSVLAGIVLLFFSIVWVLRFMVSERRIMGEALTKSELEKETLMDSITDPMAYFQTPDLDISWANLAACRVAGMPKTKISGIKCHKIYWGMDAPCESCPALKTFETGSAHEIETLTSDGKFRLLKSFPVKNQKGRLLGVIEIAYDITSLKQAESRIAASEEKYRTILETIEDGYYEVDLAGNLVFFNDSLCRILGYSRSELAGKNNRFFMSDDDSKTVYQTFNRVFATGEASKDLDIKINHKNGTIRHINVSVSLVKDRNQKPVGFRGIARDVTQHRQSQEALRMSEEKFRALAETSIDTIFQINTKGNVLYASPSVLDLSGYTVDEIVGSHFTRYFPDSQIPLALEIFQKILSGATLRSQELIAARKDGVFVNIEASFTPLLQNGRIAGIQGTIRDISERVKFQNAIKDSEERFRLLAENSVDAIWELDLNGVHQYVSPATTEIFGYTVEETIGLHFSKYLPEARLREAYELFGQVLSGRRIRSYVSEAVRKDGRTIIADFCIAPVIKNGKVVAIQGITRDVTAQKTAEKALVESRKNLETLFDAISESVFLLDEQGVLIALNKTTAERLGSTVSRMLGKKAYDFLPEKTAAFRKQKIDQVFLTGKEAQFEDERPGRHFWHSIYPIFNDAGKVTRVAVFSQDISLRKIAQDALRKSEEKYRLIFDSSPLGILHYDANGIITECNPKILELSGASYDALIGFNMLNNVREEAFLTAVLSSLAGIPGELEGKYVSVTGGKTNYLRAFTVPIHGHENNITGGICVVEDVSKRIQAEKELNKSHQKLKLLTKHLQSARENERAGIARELHDELGQTLTAINMEAAWVAQKIPGDQTPLKTRAEAISDMAVSAIGAVKRIISELRPTLLTDLGLTAAVKWQAGEYQKRAGIRFEVDIEPEEIMADEDLAIAIFRIFQEAATNVMRHARATAVSIRLKEKGGKIELAVIDNGIGIAQDKLELNDSFGIMGMRERAEAIGGSLEISGAPGKGTVVRAMFPVWR
jgi:PAS domain S-box-containing protein